MGGIGSGRPRLSEKEKREKGTLRPWREKKYAEEAAKVVTGLFLPRVPDPSLPLNEIGKAKYIEFATLLLDNGKLTKVVAEDCERYAVMYQQMHDRLTSGKTVPQTMLNAMDSLSRRLKVAEDAPSIANPGQPKRFDSVGFSNSRTSPFRLRAPGASGAGEL